LNLYIKTFRIIHNINIQQVYVGIDL